MRNYATEERTVRSFLRVSRVASPGTYPPEQESPRPRKGQAARSFGRSGSRAGTNADPAIGNQWLTSHATVWVVITIGVNGGSLPWSNIVSNAQFRTGAL